MLPDRLRKVESQRFFARNILKIVFALLNSRRTIKNLAFLKNYLSFFKSEYILLGLTSAFCEFII